MKADSESLIRIDPAIRGTDAAYRRNVLPWLLVAAWMGVIYAFSAQPCSAGITERYFGECNTFIRKLGHLSEYLILFVLIRSAWTSTFVTGRARPRAMWAALVLSVIYALTDEWHQSYVPGRSASLGDVGIDTVGATIGCVCCLLMAKLFRRAS